MKLFYSCIDAGCSKIVPQRLQHVINGQMAEQMGGRIRFYVAEENEFLAKQYNLKARLTHSPDIDGIIYYRLQQFNYGDSFDYRMLLNILSSGYEVHFSREMISITEVKELEALFPTFYVFGFLNDDSSSASAFERMAKEWHHRSG